MLKLTPAMEKVILHWGEMGSTWGVNRAVAQIYALLYLAPEPLTAEEISETLAMARSTVSTGLHELQGWGIVRPVHVLGDRRDHFESVGDVWEMFRAILTERKRREVDATLAMLRDSVAQAVREDDPHVAARLHDMLDVFETTAGIYNQVQGVPTATLVKAAKLLQSRFGWILNLITKE